MEAESENSSQPIIVSDMDVILRSELEDYKRKNEFVNTTVVDFDSLFNENGDFEVSNEMRNEVDDDVLIEDQEVEVVEEVKFREIPFSDRPTPPISWVADTPPDSLADTPPDSPSGFSSSSSEIGGIRWGAQGHGDSGGGNEDVEKPSFLQMALLDEEKIGACTSYVKDSKATLLPRSFPTRPRNCIHHMIPFSLFTQDLVKRFPFSLNAKRKLMAKYGEPPPDWQSIYFMSSTGPRYLSLLAVNIEDIPSITTSQKKIVKVSKLRTGVKVEKGVNKTATAPKKPRQVSPKVKCQFCDKAYKQQGAMKRHVLEKHGIYM